MRQRDWERVPSAQRVVHTGGRDGGQDRLAQAIRQLAASCSAGLRRGRSPQVPVAGYLGELHEPGGRDQEAGDEHSLGREAVEDA